MRCEHELSVFKQESAAYKRGRKPPPQPSQWLRVWAWHMRPNYSAGRTLSHVVNDLSHVKNWRVLGSEDTLAASELCRYRCNRLLPAMSFDRFAPLVLLVGHWESVLQQLASRSTRIAGLVVGQSGEVNSRVLAQILNNVEVSPLAA